MRGEALTDDTDVRGVTLTADEASEVRLFLVVGGGDRRASSCGSNLTRGRVGGSGTVKGFGA